MKYIDLESDVSCTSQTNEILQIDSTEWILILGRGTQSTRSLTTPQLLGYLNES